MLECIHTRVSQKVKYLAYGFVTSNLHRPSLQQRNSSPKDRHLIPALKQNIDAHRYVCVYVYVL